MVNGTSQEIIGDVEKAIAVISQLNEAEHALLTGTVPEKPKPTLDEFDRSFIPRETGVRITPEGKQVEVRLYSMDVLSWDYPSVQRYGKFMFEALKAGWVVDRTEFIEEVPLEKHAQGQIKKFVLILTREKKELD